MRYVDGAVEAVLARKSDLLKLAIEHTRIELYVGEGDDFHRFLRLWEMLRADDSLRVPGFALNVDVPVDAVPLKSNGRGIADDIDP